MRGDLVVTVYTVASEYCASIATPLRSLNERYLIHDGETASSPILAIMP